MFRFEGLSVCFPFSAQEFQSRAIPAIRRPCVRHRTETIED